ncbi:MAG: type II toxin-antitoxin system RelE/ParE family toxin [Defluviitaleaceae bacterium]|nr:type II toxin-antitoxin system RelE/ParE family toxin [Defluviitaleaceae bacterium]
MTTTYAKQAKKSIERLDPNTKKRIRQGIRKLPNGDIKRLKSYTDLYRLRIGDWRILFTMTATEIVIENILPRGGAYQ